MAINVTKTYLPPLEEYTKYLEGIWDRSYVTNRGPLVLELENKLKNYLGVKHLLFVSNGTIAIQIAIKALKLKGEIITTPFSYVATTTSILWEKCIPAFVDISPSDFCIDVNKIEAAITENTSAILATHVYGYPCNVVKIEEIANKYGIKVIYDGAHAFGVNIGDKSLLNFGDVSTLSFHATKLFHTIEGGAIITSDDKLAEQVLLYHQFGHINDDYISEGINGKNSELHAAMGLCLFPKINDFIEKRLALINLYDKNLSGLGLIRPAYDSIAVSYNGSYYPVIFPNETLLLLVKNGLTAMGVNTRRYFYPSLNTLKYVDYVLAPVSEDIASRVLCLPLFFELEDEQVELVCNLMKSILAQAAYK